MFPSGFPQHPGRVVLNITHVRAQPRRLAANLFTQSTLGTLMLITSSPSSSSSAIAHHRRPRATTLLSNKKKVLQKTSLVAAPFPLPNWRFDWRQEELKLHVQESASCVTFTVFYCTIPAQSHLFTSGLICILLTLFPLVVCLYTLSPTCSSLPWEQSPSRDLPLG